MVRARGERCVFPPAKSLLRAGRAQEKRKPRGPTLKLAQLSGTFLTTDREEWIGNGREPSPTGLGRRCIRGGQLVIGRGPDPLDALTGTDEKRRRSQGYKCHEECVLDQVLTIVIVNELPKARHALIVIVPGRVRKIVVRYLSTGNR